jgi:hypothetical protein
LEAIVTDVPKHEQPISSEAAKPPVVNPATHATSDVSASKAQPTQLDADGVDAEKMSFARVGVSINAGGDESKYKYIPESLDRILKYRLLRWAVLIAVVAGVSIYVYEKFGRKESPATINIYNTQPAQEPTHPTQEEADRSLKINKSRFYYCLYSAKEEYRAQCLDRELALWKQENDQAVLRKSADTVLNDRATQSPPPNETSRGQRPKQNRKVVSREKSKKSKSVSAGECSTTILNPNPCGPTGLTGGKGGNSSGSDGSVPTFR